MSAWTKQLSSQVKKHGKKKASWYCEWDEPSGRRRIKSCGPGTEGKRRAQLLAEKIRAQLSLGTYESDRREHKSWAEFRKEYVDRLRSRNSAAHCQLAGISFDHFERICKPKLLRGISSDTIDSYVLARTKERGARKGDKVAAPTINRELRYLRAALNRAKKSKYIAEVPDIEFLKEPGKLVRFVTPEHFALIYEACEHAESPDTSGTR